MDKEQKRRIKKLKTAILAFMGTNGRYYGQLDRLEQSVEDLAQALNTRLDQLLLPKDGCSVSIEKESPRERLASRFLETANKLHQGGKVDRETVDEFEKTLNMLDIAADFKRQSETAKDVAETAAIKHKRDKI